MTIEIPIIGADVVALLTSIADSLLTLTAPGSVLEASATANSGDVVSVLNSAVPAGKIWDLQYVEIVCRGVGKWNLTVDGVRIAGGATSASREHDRVDLPGRVRATAGQAILVEYTYSHGPNGMDLDAFIGLSES